MGEGQFPTSQEINRKYIEDLYNEGKLNITTENTTYNDGDNALPKDVIQVPNNGYVIIRTRLDNPGTWIFHCHIDFHLSIGMGLGKQNVFWQIGILIEL